jgi:hypothetical protein
MEMPVSTQRLVAAIVAFVVFGAAGAFVWVALGPGDDPPPPVDGDGTTLYESDAVVLESSAHGAELCVGGVADSLPPQCSGIPISNWRWNMVDGEESASGSTWGQFHVVGRYDGTDFTVTDAGPYQQPPSNDGDPFAAPCPEPHGGWVATDPSRATEEHLQMVMRTAKHQSDSAGIWVDYLVPPETVDEGTVAPNDVIFVAAFTGDLVRHEAELREIWGGPLCVTRHNRTMRELERIQAGIASEVGDQLGIEKTWSSIDVMANEVELGVVVADEDVREALDERFGPGAVELHPALLRVR